MTYWVYILASKPGGTLYVGVTNNLVRRVYEQATALETQAFQADGTAVVNTALPMTTLRPGDYLLSVEIAGNGRAEREARITIESARPAPSRARCVETRY